MIHTSIVVFGATPAGICAAIAAAREGRTVSLVEPGYRIGGMMSGGLGATDMANTLTVGGLAAEFFKAVYDFYVWTYGRTSAQVKDCQGGYRFEPAVAEVVFEAMIEACPTLTLYAEQGSIVSSDTVESAIASIEMASGNAFSGTVFIDASYEGDLLVPAGCAFTFGREAQADFMESLAGVRPSGACSVLDTIGNGDNKVQACTYRLCASQAEDRIRWTMPEGYDASAYDFLSEVFAHAAPERVFSLANVATFAKIPNGKADVNNGDGIALNWGFPLGTDEERHTIAEAQKNYQMGLMWYLSTDERVPQAIRDGANSWGLAVDEFTESGGWPFQLYIRECVRLRGAYVLSQNDLTTNTVKHDAIHVGSYPIDSHHVQRVINDAGHFQAEGNVNFVVPPFAVPYRCITPKESDCVNLLVPVCISATHIAYGSLRMEPDYMAMGQAAGIAASLTCAQSYKCVQRVSTATLRLKLAATGVMLSPEQVLKTLPAVDDKDRRAVRVGVWKESSATPGFIGPCYLHDLNEGKGEKSVTYKHAIPKAGIYEARVYFAACANRATNVPVTVDGELCIVNQRAPNTNGYAVAIRKEFQPGIHYIVISTEETDGYVIADATRFVEVV